MLQPLSHVSTATFEYLGERGRVDISSQTTKVTNDGMIIHTSDNHQSTLLTTQYCWVDSANCVALPGSLQAVEVISTRKKLLCLHWQISICTSSCDVWSPPRFKIHRNSTYPIGLLMQNNIAYHCYADDTQNYPALSQT